MMGSPGLGTPFPWAGGSRGPVVHPVAAAAGAVSLGCRPPGVAHVGRVAAVYRNPAGPGRIGGGDSRFRRPPFRGARLPLSCPASGSLTRMNPGALLSRSRRQGGRVLRENSLLVLVDSRGRGRSAGPGIRSTSTSGGCPVFELWLWLLLPLATLRVLGVVEVLRDSGRAGVSPDAETGERPTSSEVVRRFLSRFSSAAVLRPRWLPFFPHPERRVSRPSFRLRGRPARTVRCRLSASVARPDKVRRKRHRGATVSGAGSDPVSTRVRAASSSGYSQGPRRFTRPRSPARRVGGGRAPVIGEPERRKCAVSQSQVLSIFPSLAW